ncbi:GNAT family N-acetyltransferase [Anaeroselena agilis]|uniref:GNAT family N-acetyltransferase n=1 Tax=Anaeroselena agilis TaxID=3063788 RepID=A0ABU3NSL7_9FIRM|nr:GNAT family N-acetyltransferase [Selenomonadales bacterium 4137-cl]
MNLASKYYRPKSPRGGCDLDRTITFAEPADEETLRTMFTAAGMDLAGEAEEHVVLRDGANILAGGRLYQADEDLFHLLVFAVAQGERGRGTGRRLMRELCERPWEYCRDAVEPTGGTFRITTMAKGESAAFYKRCDYRECEASLLPPPFDSQCEDCPDCEQCGPVAMVYSRT